MTRLRLGAEAQAGPRPRTLGTPRPRAARIAPPAALVDAHTLFSCVSGTAITVTALPLALRPPDAPAPLASYGGSPTPDVGPPPTAGAARTRALHVALTTVSFLPYINFTAFGALTALDLARGKHVTRHAPTARAAVATALYACPLVLLAVTGDAHAAVASTFLCAAHFTAESVLRGAEAADAGAAAPATDDALLAAAADVAAAADARALQTWDARLALARARREHLVALATRAGVRVTTKATRASLAAALAEAAGLDAPTGVTPPAPWLLAELAAAGAADVDAAAARAARRRRRKDE